MNLRRTVGTALVAVLVLTGCSGGRSIESLASDLATAAKTVDGVSDADLAAKKGSGGDDLIVGEVTLSTSDANSSAATLRKVFVAMVPALKEGRAVFLRFETKDANGNLVPNSAAGINGYPASAQVIERFGG